MNSKTSPQNSSGASSPEIQYSTNKIGQRSKVKYFTKVKFAPRSLAQILRRSKFFKNKKRLAFIGVATAILVAAAIIVPLVIRAPQKPPVSQPTAPVISRPDKGYQRKSLQILYSSSGYDNSPAINYLERQEKKADLPKDKLGVVLAKVKIYNLDQHYKPSLKVLKSLNTQGFAKKELAEYYVALSEQYKLLGDDANAKIYEEKAANEK